MTPQRDPLEFRRHKPTIPTDLNDPPRFSQMVETTQDALVLELREFFNQQGFRTAERAETPTIEKYAIGFGEGLDPYETFLKIVADFPDVLERLPHVAVTTISGQNKRMTAGRPFIAHTQAPPRVVTSNAGPYALANPVPQITTVSIVTLPGGVAEPYTVSVEGEPVTVAFDPGVSRELLAATLAAALRTSPVGLVCRVTSSTGAAAAVTIEHRTPGVAFSVGTTANLSAAVAQAAGNASAPSMLVYQTKPNGVTPVTSVCVFAPSRFATTEPLSAVPATALARVFNEQALYAYARVVALQAGDGVQLETGGKLGGSMPNEIEVLSSSTPALVLALGLGNAGVGIGGSTIGGVAPAMTLNIAAAAFTAAMVGRYVTIAGATSSVNNGHFLISAGATGILTYDNPLGVAEPFAGTYFIGLRDDTTNILRPVMNRYHMSMALNITIDVLAESPNERRETLDLVLGEFLFNLELKFFTLYGRGIFDPDGFPDEHYQISVAQEVQDTGTQEFPRGEDQKNKIYSARVIVPVTTTWYIDRTVLVPSGPQQGRSWTLEARNITQDDALPSSS